MVIDTYDVLAAIAQRFPTYCIHNYCFDHGAMGGSYPDSDEQAGNTGELAARVLSGEPPERVPVVNGHHVRAQVDWRELRERNIPESRLPANTLVLYRQPTVWERYEEYIVAGIILIVIQTLLIARLLWHGARKKRIEAKLRESEERFRVMVDTAPALIWTLNRDGTVIALNRRTAPSSGGPIVEPVEETWMDTIHPDDLPAVQLAHATALKTREPFSREFRLRRRDGGYQWMVEVAAPRTNGRGEFAGFIGSTMDVTDQKLAQEALRTVSGKLIEAQEAERSRIARELHDHICQRLAILSLELEQASESANGSAGHILEMREHCNDIAMDVQALSHELHSSKLQYLGLVPALRTFCNEFSEKHSVTVHFTYEKVPASLPIEVSLCLFRVAQEALRNALKYSGTRDFSVHLSGTDEGVELEVGDSGTGFDVEAAILSRGLGLVSMQERIHLIKGSLSIESRPNCGTKVTARAPLHKFVSVESVGQFQELR